MNHILSICKKELRAYFLSPVALIFLLMFLFVTLFWFFNIEPKFWSRNLADIRPLFEIFPVMLIFLVAALTMRLWSEEQKLGTLEVLMTMPVKTHHLVLGKFLAGFTLVGLALIMTFHVPLIVSLHGQIDWGPVVGGYLATLLLASTYLSIGLCMSSITENQIVALVSTTIVCGLLYLVGSDAMTGFVANETGELMRALGTGSRFESIGRGVVDFRDLLYYVSLTVIFLVVNTTMLRAKRWSTGARTKKQRLNRRAFTWLVAANLAVMNITMFTVRTLRLDMTEQNIFSVSPVTKGLVKNLSSPLLLRGYFSQKTHPLLAPLVPQIRDLLSEYGAISEGRVTVEFVDPQTDEATEKEAGQSYNIRSFPFRMASKYESGVVNSFFSILVKFGDQYEVLNFNDLIEVNVSADGEPEVKLRNLEYDLTRAIKKTAYGFETLEAVFEDMTADAELTAYLSPATLPQELAAIPDYIERTAKEIESKSSGKFKFRIIDPTTPENSNVAEDIAKKFGIRAMARDLFGQERFYAHLLLRVGDTYQRIIPQGDTTEASIKTDLTSALKRGTPGFLKTIGLFKSQHNPPDLSQQYPGMPKPEPKDMLTVVAGKLRENFTVRNVDLETGSVPGDIDVLLVLDPMDLTDKASFAIDQHLMRGGAVVILSGRYSLDPNGLGREGIKLKRVSSGLDSLLKSYGVTIEDTLVMDPQNEKFPIPVMKDLGGFRVQQIQLVNYPFFIDVRSDGMNQTSPIMGGLPSVTMHWASPLSVTLPDVDDDEEQSREMFKLIQSTPDSWVRAESSVQPNFQLYPEVGFAVGEERARHTLAVALKGQFESAFKDRPNPLYSSSGDTNQPNADFTGRTLKKSPTSSRLVVVGTSNFVNDIVLNLSRQSGGDRATSNLQFVENILDWSVADVDLLSIRSRGTFARTLLPRSSDERQMYEFATYGIAVFFLLALILLTAGSRRRLKKFELVKRADSSAPASNA
ncbi:MAG: Gldg family protein [Myxococcota bacterium]|nr:Gldg family protein [Myxococcota bacterium]